MNQLVRKALNLLVGTEAIERRPVVIPDKTVANRPLKRMSERKLIQMESELGAEVFGPIPDGHRREFFNLDPSTWIWYDEWSGQRSGHKQSVTIRYEIHENGILKVRKGSKYDFLEGAELRNFINATNIYYERVCRNIYGVDPMTSAIGYQAQGTI